MMRTSERHVHREPTREVKLQHQHTRGTRAWRTHDICTAHMELATISRIAHATVAFTSPTAVLDTETPNPYSGVAPVAIIVLEVGRSNGADNRSAIAEDILCSRGVLAAEVVRSGIDGAT